MSASFDMWTVDSGPSSSASAVRRVGIDADEEGPPLLSVEEEPALISLRGRLLRSPLLLPSPPLLRSLAGLLRSSPSSSKDRLNELLSVGIDTLILGHLSPIVLPGVDDGGEGDERTNARVVAGRVVARAFLSFSKYRRL